MQLKDGSWRRYDSHSETGSAWESVCQNQVILTQEIDHGGEKLLELVPSKGHSKSSERVSSGTPSTGN
jgi:hypothetical protein